MQEALVNPKITQSKIFTLDEYKNFSPINEFLLYSDNILEGITLLNTLTKTDDLLSFFGVIYEPVDQPIYIFKDLDNQLYSIKICGAYNKWDLPEVVGDICNFIDLPDYIFYSLSSQKAILAGENTETASVGNSQWQREGRKIGAARHGVPFIKPFIPAKTNLKILSESQVLCRFIISFCIQSDIKSLLLLPILKIISKEL